MDQLSQSGSSDQFFSLSPSPAPQSPQLPPTILPVELPIELPIDQLSQSEYSDPFASPSPLPAPQMPPAPITTPTPAPVPVMLALPPLATYPSKEALFEAIQSWSKPRGYAFTISRSSRLKSKRQKVTYACDRYPLVRPPIQGIRETQSRGSGCLFSIIAAETPTLN
jgi:hypothetical protein